ncbi:hypothetical protein LEP1GSC061_2631 [Leptospira wolffii serovar Khorat str. Khorat-H2]|nr:hypothetical protein LEP1GSC061_2631 [Leptospira wolffii serovar Khorat str. Khorat-H2]
MAPIVLIFPNAESLSSDTELDPEFVGFPPGKDRFRELF